MTHTPGEWKVYTDHPDERGIHYVRTSPSLYHGEVAVLFGSNDHAHADAHLIAAAKDLLALARQYASECAGCTGEGTWVRVTNIAGPAIREPCADCADIRKIIAKATGES